jgi:hypothetical protein
MEVTLAQEYTGTADSGTATSLTDSDIAGTYSDDYFNGYTLKITDGTGEGETATVTDYNGATGAFTFSAGLSGSSTPDSTSEYRIARSTDVIDADSGRYLLGDYFGSVSGDITYDRQTNVGTEINWCDEATIRDLREDTKTTGYPYLAAIRSYDYRQYELIVWPYPSADLTISFPYEIMFDKMELEAGVADSGSATTLVDNHLSKYADDYFNNWTLTVLNGTGKGETATITDFDQGTYTLTFSALSGGSTPDSTSEYMLEPATKYHPAGAMFDDAVLSACLARAETQIDDVQNNYVEYYHSKALVKAYQLNNKLAPRKLGSLNTYIPGYRKLGGFYRERRIVRYNGE